MAKGWFGNSQGHAKAGRLGGLAKARRFKGPISTPHKVRKSQEVKYSPYDKGGTKRHYRIGRGPGGIVR
jgi:hypothetical protein